MITTTVHDDIRAFAAAVRSHLDDLPADEVDDLLDGLEADLSDQASEAGDDFELPDATTYAAELRAAAGLPERGSVATPKKRFAIVDDVRHGWREIHDRVRANAAGAWLLDLLVSLRPAWWVLRGVVFYLWIFLSVMSRPSTGGILDAFLTLRYNPVSWAILLTSLLVSIQWGRGRWAPFRWIRVVRTVSTVIAVIAVPMLAGSISTAMTQLFTGWVDAPQVGYETPGLAIDGQRIRNIYAYDAAGDPITGVQLFDQDGNPLRTVQSDAASESYDPYFAGGGGPVPVPETYPGAAPQWNVFPLREVPAGEWTWDGVGGLSAARLPAFPFDRVQPLPEPDRSAVSTGLGPTPSSGVSPTPLVQPTGSITP
ncbi:hypothetical protein [Microbacterium hydrothermale]|uniref:hypothetical protein n=1 Tax=Microbacterium hydrothermale TaxID=857427 RepID=UPI0010A78A11|nr:hypothetical protein [Microbacterium hydrothermale]